MTVGGDVLPCQEADAADENQQGERDADERICAEGGDRRERIGGSSQKVKARVAERRNRMKQRVPDALCAKVAAEGRQEQEHSRALGEERAAQNERGHADDAADLRRGDGILHGAALKERNFPSREPHEAERDGDHAESADLNQKQDYDLPEQRPVRACAANDQSRDAGGGGGGQERFMKRGDRAALRGDGEHQQERTAQNQRGKAENDDLRGIHMSAQFGMLHACCSPFQSELRTVYHFSTIFVYREIPTFPARRS